MNWEDSNEWFKRYHYQNLTNEFKSWWEQTYGNPSDYPNNREEQEEYWIRCGFALLGWVAHENHINDRS